MEIYLNCCEKENSVLQSFTLYLVNQRETSSKNSLHSFKKLSAMRETQPITLRFEFYSTIHYATKFHAFNLQIVLTRDEYNFKLLFCFILHFPVRAYRIMVKY